MASYLRCLIGHLQLRASAHKDDIGCALAVMDDVATLQAHTSQEGRLRPESLRKAMEASAAQCAPLQHSLYAAGCTWRAEGRAACRGGGRHRTLATPSMEVPGREGMFWRDSAMVVGRLRFSTATYTTNSTAGEPAWLCDS